MNRFFGFSPIVLFFSALFLGSVVFGLNAVTADPGAQQAAEQGVKSAVELAASAAPAIVPAAPISDEKPISAEKKVLLSPLAIIKDTVTKVIKTNSELPGDENVTPRRAKLREIINPHFNFDEMAKRSLGINWKNITAEQQTDFVTVFSNLLAKTYLQRIDSVVTNVVSYSGEKIEGENAVVKTMITHKGDQFPIDYKMLNYDGAWRVYDVVIENIGLVANYRNEFSGIIRKEGFDALMKKLRKKSEG